MSKPRINWRHQYDQERDEKEGAAAILECKDESLTVQSFADDANLNILAKRFGITDIPNVPISTEEPFDNTTVPELREILEARRTAAHHFMSLPLKLRKRFRNNPEELWTFLQDPDNHEEAVRLGLLFRPADPASTSPPTARGNTTDGTSPTAQPAPAGSQKSTETTPKETPASK